MSAVAPPGDRGQMLYLLLAGLFVTALVTCNLIAARFVSLDLSWLLPFREHPFVVSAGILPYPVTFMVTDVLSELYGRRRASRVVLVGFFCSIFALAILQLGAAVPAIDGSMVSDAEFDRMFSNASRAIFASMSAYLVAQLVDIRIFHVWKRRTQGRHLWLRNNFSTMTSQLVDTVLVVSLLYAGTWPAGQILDAILDGWLFKVLVAAADTPLIYAAVYLLRGHVPEEEGPHTMFT